MSEGHENDFSFWENQFLMNLSNGTSDNSGGDKVIPIIEFGEEKGKQHEQSTTNKGKEVKGEKSDMVETSDHKTHIWTERERRKKMKNMFANLHSLLPQLSPKADKSTIVDEAISYIKTLEATLQRLQKQKFERLQGGLKNTLSCEPSVAATSKLAMLSTRESFVADQLSAQSKNDSSSAAKTSATHSASASHLPVVIETWTSPNVVLNICGNDAQFAIYAPNKSGLFTAVCCVMEKYKLEVVSAHVNTEDDRSVYMIQARLANGAVDQFPESITVDEIFKKAAGDLMLWVSS